MYIVSISEPENVKSNKSLYSSEENIEREKTTDHLLVI